jgi:hypothetical protein
MENLKALGVCDGNARAAAILYQRDIQDGVILVTKSSDVFSNGLSILGV